MIALHRPVAASAPLVDSYYIFRDGRGKIKKQRPRETFFDFFSFSKKSRPPASARYVEYPVTGAKILTKPFLVIEFCEFILALWARSERFGSAADYSV
jgi:hypothetical protein